MVKWIRLKWTPDPEVGVLVQDKVSKKESIEYSVKCVVEGVDMRVCKEGATWPQLFKRWIVLSTG